MSGRVTGEWGGMQAPTTLFECHNLIVLTVVTVILGSASGEESGLEGPKGLNSFSVYHSRTFDKIIGLRHLRR